MKIKNMILKNNNGKLELYKNNGALWIKYPFNDVKYADLSNDEELVLVTFGMGMLSFLKQMELNTSVLLQMAKLKRRDLLEMML
jgi:hypothetical protein